MSDFQAKEDHTVTEQEPLWPYIGNWQALQNGTVHTELVKKLIEQGIKPQVGKAVPLEDALARYKAVPLHSRLLYTSMDPFIEISLLAHYATIDSMSRDKCDNYVSFEQLNNPAETIDYLEQSPVLKASGVKIGYVDLPGIFFWDHQWEGEFISFGPHADDLKFKTVLSRVFEEIRQEPTIAAVRRAKLLLSQEL